MQGADRPCGRGTLAISRFGRSLEIFSVAGCMPSRLRPPCFARIRLNGRKPDSVMHDRRNGGDYVMHSDRDVTPSPIEGYTRRLAEPIGGATDAVLARSARFTISSIASRLKARASARDTARTIVLACSRECALSSKLEPGVSSGKPDSEGLPPVSFACRTWSAKEITIARFHRPQFHDQPSSSTQKHRRDLPALPVNRWSERRWILRGRLRRKDPYLHRERVGSRWRAR